MCPFCVGIVEDEIHVILDCTTYDDIRARYIKTDAACTNKQELVRKMLNGIDEDQTVKLAKFLFLAWKIRLSKM